MRLAVLGLGLIGGSVVRALRRPGATADDAWAADLEIAAWSPSGDGPRRAAAEGIVDLAAESADAAVAGADVVLLAGPPRTVFVWLDAFGGPLRDRLPEAAVVTDVASTKAAIVERAETLRLRFVGGHPMAGRETSGYVAARADLFEARPWVVVPAETADDRAIELVEGLARAVGAVPVRMAAEEHDRAVAAVSHLPLLASVALVETVLGRPGEAAPDDAAVAARLAASGWRDATRLARGEPAMGAGILSTNRAAVAERVRRLRAILDDWLAVLDGHVDEEIVRERLAAARARLEAASEPRPGTDGGR